MFKFYVIVLTILSLLDLVTSFIGFHFNFPEAAPIASSLILTGGVYTAVLLKAFAWAVSIYLFHLIRDYKKAVFCALISLGIFLIPVINNSLLILGMI